MDLSIFECHSVWYHQYFCIALSFSISVDKIGSPLLPKREYNAKESGHCREMVEGFGGFMITEGYLMEPAA